MAEFTTSLLSPKEETSQKESSDPSEERRERSGPRRCIEMAGDTGLTLTKYVLKR